MFQVFALAGLAIALSATAACYSIVGLRAFASGAPDAVTILGGTLELAKLVLAAWLHMIWQTAPRPMRWLGVGFTAAIMLLTLLGIFSFLWNAHNAQAAKRDMATTRVEHVDERITIHKDALNGARRELESLLKEYEALDQAGRLTKGRQAREADQGMADGLRRRIADEQVAIEKLQTEKVDVAAGASEVSAELGAAKALARALGGDEASAVNVFIALMMIPFDPLAVYFSVAAAMAYSAAQRSRKEIAGEYSEITGITGYSEQGAAEKTTAPEVLLQQATKIDDGIVEAAPQLASAEIVPIKRGPGRPKGAKNKPKVADASAVGVPQSQTADFLDIPAE